MTSRKKQLRKLARTQFKDEAREEHEETKKENKRLKKELEEAGDAEKVEELEAQVKELKSKMDDKDDLGDLLTKSDLKAILDSRDEKTSGSKKELVKRVKNG